jgi:hypothetical protein
MAEDTDVRAFVHERFRRTDGKVDRLAAYMVTMTDRLSSLGKQAAGLRDDVARIDFSLDGFEKRLDLADTAIAG